MWIIGGRMDGVGLPARGVTGNPVEVRAAERAAARIRAHVTQGRGDHAVKPIVGRGNAQNRKTFV